MRSRNFRTLARLSMVISTLATVVGCVSQQPGTHRMARYAPKAPSVSAFPDRPRPDGTVASSSRTAADPTPASASETHHQGTAPSSVVANTLPPAGDASTRVTPTDKSDVLESADRLVILWSAGGQEEQHRDVIDGSGEVNLKYVGRVKIAGLTTSEAERRIEEAFVKNRIFDQVNVSVIKEQEELYVQGEVNRPGAIPVTSGLTLVKAIAKAGGFGPFAKKSRIYLIRNGESTVYDYDDIMDGDLEDPKLEAGDVINVGKRW